MRQNELEMTETVQTVQIASPNEETIVVEKTACGLIAISSPRIRRYQEESRRNYEKLREKNRGARSTHPWASYGSSGNERYNPH
jgi:hypothetical protein